MGGAWCKIGLAVARLRAVCARRSGEVCARARYALETSALRDRTLRVFGKRKITAEHISTSRHHRAVRWFLHSGVHTHTIRRSASAASRRGGHDRRMDRRRVPTRRRSPLRAAPRSAAPPGHPRPAYTHPPCRAARTASTIMAWPRLRQRHPRHTKDQTLPNAREGPPRGTRMTWYHAHNMSCARVTRRHRRGC